jgi:3-oxoadipate enol-lactonase
MRYFGNNISLIVNDMVVSYSDLGPDDAPIIIFIHGFPLNKTMWNEQVDALKDNFRVIAYDIRGHGESDAGNDPFSIDLFVTDLIRFMDTLKISKASLCGLSMGGYIALKAVESYSERFESIVLSDTTCLADLPEAKEKRMKSIENIINNGVYKYADGSLNNLFAPESLLSKPDEMLSVKKMIINTSELSLCSTLLALASREETCTNLSKINIPVLILVGEKDKIIPQSAAKFMQKKIKNSSLKVIESAGHLSNLENPKVFNDYLKDFFDPIYKQRINNNQSSDHTILRDLRNKLNMLLSFRSI